MDGGAAELFDLADREPRELHAVLHAPPAGTNRAYRRIVHPRGRHAIAVGVGAPWELRIEGHCGYYAAGMNDGARVLIEGNAGPGVAENMMAGEVRVTGDAGQSAGATAHGGLLVIGGNAGARCGISLKGADIVVRGDVGHLSAFMAQAGNLVVCGNAGEALGDSLYEARLFVAGTVASLGADCEEQTPTEADRATLTDLLARAQFVDVDPDSFRVYGSARRLYHFHVDNAGAY